ENTAQWQAAQGPGRQQFGWTEVQAHGFRQLFTLLRKQQQVQHKCCEEWGKPLHPALHGTGPGAWDGLQETVRIIQCVNTRSVAACRQRILDRNAAADVEVGSMDISMNCPISQSRIRIPVKGSSCTHVTCFDLESYLRMYSTYPVACRNPAAQPRCNHCSKKPCMHCRAFRCPLCRQPVGLSQLVVDALFAQALAGTAQRGGLAEATLVQASATWQFASSAAEPTVGERGNGSRGEGAAGACGEGEGSRVVLIDCGEEEEEEAEEMNEEGQGQDEHDEDDVVEVREVRVGEGEEASQATAGPSRDELTPQEMAFLEGQLLRDAEVPGSGLAARGGSRPGGAAAAASAEAPRGMRAEASENAARVLTQIACHLSQLQPDAVAAIHRAAATELAGAGAGRHSEVGGVIEILSSDEGESDSEPGQEGGRVDYPPRGCSRMGGGRERDAQSAPSLEGAAWSMPVTGGSAPGALPRTAGGDGASAAASGTPELADHTYTRQLQEELEQLLDQDMAHEEPAGSHPGMAMGTLREAHAWANETLGRFDLNEEWGAGDLLGSWEAEDDALLSPGSKRDASKPAEIPSHDNLEAPMRGKCLTKRPRTETPRSRAGHHTSRESLFQSPHPRWAPRLSHGVDAQES
ncbi:hypothetical protein CYMTET_17104, partial [Cymbomonas tetramitiformis]